MKSCTQSCPGSVETLTPAPCLRAVGLRVAADSPLRRLNEDWVRMNEPTTSIPPAPAEARRPLGVLLVDDHAEYLASAASFLRHLPDVRVVGTASDGPEAIRLTRSLAPDLVLLDLTMPGMDGLATARILKGRPAAPWVVIVTAEATRSCSLAVAACGADGLVNKADAPAELPALLARFGQLAARRNV